MRINTFNVLVSLVTIYQITKFGTHIRIRGHCEQGSVALSRSKTKYYSRRSMGGQ
jgi:hypothetical protein